MTNEHPEPWHVRWISGPDFQVTDANRKPVPGIDAVRLLSSAGGMLALLRRWVPEGHDYREHCDWNDGKPCLSCETVAFLANLGIGKPAPADTAASQEDERDCARCRRRLEHGERDVCNACQGEGAASERR